MTATLPQLHLNIIPIASVHAAIQVARDTDTETDKFNTHFHTHAEIAAVIPENPTAGFRHVFPNLTASHFHHWIHLIASSQGFTTWHEFHLSSILLSYLIEGHNVWRNRGTRRLKSFIHENLFDLFPPQTIQGTSTTAVLNGRTAWFIRLDFCSTKDGTSKDDITGHDGTPDTTPATTVEDALTRICTSNRGSRTLRDIAEKIVSGPARMFLVPYNKDMNVQREFRIFCPPVALLSIQPKPTCLAEHHNIPHDPRPTAHSPTGEDRVQTPRPRLTAISQYRWNAAYYRTELACARDDAASAVCAAYAIHARILAHAATLPDPNVLCRLQTEGFVFDIFETNGGEMQLLELNPFGAMSGCGSCLFHWIEDAEVLYGEREGIEVRLVM